MGDEPNTVQNDEATQSQPAPQVPEQARAEAATQTPEALQPQPVADIAHLIGIGGEKADLKAVRESIGINQIDLANMLDVTVRTIKRWEQIGWEEPPDYVWDLLQDLVLEHEHSVCELVAQTEAAARTRASERIAAGRNPWIVELPYFKNQDHYEQFPHRRHSQHAWGNAISRRAADILRMRGYTVYFYYPTAEDGN